MVLRRQRRIEHVQHGIVMQSVSSSNSLRRYFTTFQNASKDALKNHPEVQKNGETCRYLVLQHSDALQKSKQKRFNEFPFGPR